MASVAGYVGENYTRSSVMHTRNIVASAKPHRVIVVEICDSPSFAPVCSDSHALKLFYRVVKRPSVAPPLARLRLVVEGIKLLKAASHYCQSFDRIKHLSTFTIRLKAELQEREIPVP